jgi:hypothetical protein
MTSQFIASGLPGLEGVKLFEKHLLDAALSTGVLHNLKLGDFSLAQKSYLTIEIFQEMCGEPLSYCGMWYWLLRL